MLHARRGTVGRKGCRVDPVTQVLTVEGKGCAVSIAAPAVLHGWKQAVLFTEHQSKDNARPHLMHDSAPLRHACGAENCEDPQDHAMPVVGYGTDDSGEQYWLLKNSCELTTGLSQWTDDHEL